MKNLLVIVDDMQYDFLHGELKTDDALAVVPNIISKVEKCKEIGDYEVAIIKFEHNFNFDTVDDAKSPLMDCNDNGHSMSWEVKPKVFELFENPTCIHERDKPSSVFLLDYLETHTFDRIELVGVCTDTSVFANATVLKTFHPDTQIVVDASCCVGSTTDKHKSTLSSMRALQIEIINEEK